MFSKIYELTMELTYKNTIPKQVPRLEEDKENDPNERILK